MVVVMLPGATDAQIDAVGERLHHSGAETFVSRGRERTIIGLIGPTENVPTTDLRQMAGVADVIRVSTPYKIIARDEDLQRSTVIVGGGGSGIGGPQNNRGGPGVDGRRKGSSDAQVSIGPDTFTLIAGPCAVESYSQTLEAAEMAKAAGATLLRGGAFKPLTTPDQFPGLGEDALKILAETRETTGLPFVTEVIDPRDVEVVAAYADMIQVGARNMHNGVLLDAVRGAGVPVLLKRSADATIQEWLMAAEFVARGGNLDIVLCERGIRTFEPSTQTTLDLSSVPIVQALSHLPVVVDPTHAPGRRDLVVPLSRAAIAIGADGILVDVHPDPESALCDGAQALAGAAVRELASAVRRIPPIVGRTTA